MASPAKIVGVPSGGVYIDDEVDPEDDGSLPSTLNTQGTGYSDGDVVADSFAYAPPAAYSYFQSESADSENQDPTLNEDLWGNSSNEGQRSELFWNKAYQAILSMPSGSLEKYNRLKRLASDFSYVSEQYGQVIISEYHLPDDMKSIHPAGVGGIAGGSKYFCSGVMFKFANDVQVPSGRWIYGDAVRDDFLAMKSANHDLKGSVAIMQANIPLLCTSLMSVIDYRGFRLCAQSFLPISDSTLRYGSNDGGARVRNDEYALSDKIRELAHRLNLKRHTVLSRSNQKQLELYGPFDMEGHQSPDGRFYVVDLSRLYPPEAPDMSNPGQKQQVLAHRLRPEFCAKYPRPLSSDGFCRVESETLKESNDEIIAATRFLRERKIPEFAASLNRETCSHLSLKREIHRAGINMRHMGLILKHVSTYSARVVLITDMVMRSIKQIIRKEWRDASESMVFSSRDVFHEILAARLNNTFYFGADSDFDAFWESTGSPLLATLSSKFLVTKTDLCSEDYPLLRKQVDLKALFNKLQTALGFVVTDRAISSHQADVNSGLYAFIAEDIERLQPVCKHSHLVWMASGVSLYFKAKGRMDRQGEALLSLALDVLHQAHSAAPFDQEVIFYLAKTYHAMLRRTNVTIDSDTKFRNLVTKALEYYQIAMSAGWDASRCYRNKLRVCLTAASKTRLDEYFHMAVSLFTEYSEAVEKKSETIDFLSKTLSKPGATVGPSLLNFMRLGSLSETIKAYLISSVKEIDLRGCSDAKPPLLRCVFSLPWQVTQYSLGHCSQLDDQLLSVLISNASAAIVTKFYVNECWKLTDASLQLIADKLTHIQTLNISGCNSMTTECLRSILETKEPAETSDEPQFAYLKSLYVLFFADCKLMDLRCVHAALARPALNKLFCSNIAAAGQPPNGTTPIKASLVSFACSWAVSDDFILNLVQSCPKLISLTILTPDDLHSTTLVSLAERCTQLEAVEIGTNHNWTDEVLNAFSEFTTKLTSLEINSQLFSKEAITRFVSRQSTLESLSLFGRSKFFDSDVFEVMVSSSTKSLSSVSFSRLDGEAKPKIELRHWLLPLLQIAPNLTYLKLDRCKLEDQTMELLFKSCVRLQSVSIFNCFWEGATLPMLISKCSELYSLQLVNTFITATNFIEAAKYLPPAGSRPSLRNLQVISCRRVTEVGLISFIEKLPNLKRLNLQYTNSTDKTLWAIARSCHQLENLDIMAAVFSSHCLSSTLGEIPSLNQISIRDCTGLTQYAIAKLLSSSAIMRFDISSSTFPHVSSNKQAAELIFEQALLTRNRSEVGIFVAESVLRWKHSLVGTKSSVRTSLLNDMFTRISSLLTSLGTNNSKLATRTLACFAAEWPELLAESSQLRELISSWIVSNGLRLSRLPTAFSDTKLANFVSSISTNLGQVTKLHISRCPHLTSESLIGISTYFTNLVYLNLSHNETAVTSAVIAAFSQSNSALEEVRIRNCLNDISEGISHLIIRHGSSLKCLDLALAPEADPNWTVPFSIQHDESLQIMLEDRCLEAMAANCSALETLVLRGRNSAVSNSAIAAVFKSNTSLTHLDVRRCEKLDSRELVKSLRCLKQLCCFKCHGPVDEKAMQAITTLECVSSLKTLNFELLDPQVTSKYVTGIIKAAPNLDALSVMHTTIENRQYSTIIKFIARWRPNMRKLRITIRKANEGDFKGFIDACTKLETFYKRSSSCEPTEGIVLNLPLRHLGLESAHQLHFPAPSPAFAENIRSMRFTALNSIVPLATALVSCTNLKTLAILFSQNLSDTILTDLAANVRQLEHMELDGCRNITNAGVAAVAESCRGLRSLSLSACTRLTNDATISIMHYLHELDHVRLLAVWITPDCISRMRQVSSFLVDYKNAEDLPRQALDTMLGPFDLARVLKPLQ